MNFKSTQKGSLCEDFFPKGWDLDKMDECCSHAPEEITERQSFWNKDFNSIAFYILFDTIKNIV